MVKIKDQIPLVPKLPGRWSLGGEKKGKKLAALLTAVDLSDWLKEKNKEQKERGNWFSLSYNQEQAKCLFIVLEARRSVYICAIFSKVYWH